MSASNSHTCALKSDGTVECWGDNNQSQTDIPLGLSDVVQISVGYGHSCALKSDGTVECWGDSYDMSFIPPNINHDVVEVTTD
ncbi:hypothetical protein H6769_02305 [Candidatus Peribacteria bacterium]|nr:hypothetical protein [Candidatus Peribacteria bacterium]